MTLNECIEKWVRTANTPATARARRGDAELFIKFLPSPDLSAVTPETIQAFMAERLESNDSARTVHRRIAHIKSLCKLIAEYNPGWINAATRCKAPGYERKQVYGLTQAESDALVSTAYANGRNMIDRQRNGTLVLTLLTTGLRVEEVASLKESNWDGVSRFRKIRTKGNKFRSVYLPIHTQDALKEYLKIRASWLQSILVQNDDYPLFMSTRYLSTKSLQPKVIWQIVARNAWRAGLPHVHPHMLRHTYALGLYERTKDIRLVSQALGHQSITTTMAYLEIRECEQDEKIQNTYDRASAERKGEGVLSQLDRLSSGVSGQANGGSSEQNREAAAKHLEEYLLSGSLLELLNPVQLNILRQKMREDASQEDHEPRRHDSDDAVVD